MSVFVDTSALYAVLDASDAAHARAAESWVRLLESKRELVTSNYVTVEMTALVQHRLGMSALRTVIGDVFGLVRIEWVSRDDHERAIAALLAASRRKLSLVDCVSFELMRRTGIYEAFALDRHFRDAGFDLV